MPALRGPPFYVGPRRDGGIGRRSGLKIRRWQQRGGSIPPPGTIRGLSHEIDNLAYDSSKVFARIKPLV